MVVMMLGMNCLLATFSLLERWKFHALIPVYALSEHVEVDFGNLRPRLYYTDRRGDTPRAKRPAAPGGRVCKLPLAEERVHAQQSEKLGQEKGQLRSRRRWAHTPVQTTS
jgi:hypothetical protein